MYGTGIPVWMAVEPVPRAVKATFAVATYRSVVAADSFAVREVFATLWRQDGWWGPAAPYSHRAAWPRHRLDDARSTVEEAASITGRLAGLRAAADRLEEFVESLAI